jgi:hypothetical protein
VSGEIIENEKKKCKTHSRPLKYTIAIKNSISALEYIFLCTDIFCVRYMYSIVIQYLFSSLVHSLQKNIHVTITFLVSIIIHLIRNWCRCQVSHLICAAKSTLKKCRIYLNNVIEKPTLYPIMVVRSEVTTCQNQSDQIFHTQTTFCHF